MRAYDVLRAADYIRGRADCAGRPVVLVGEGTGGLWCLLAAAFDESIQSVITVRTLLSYRMLVENPYYEVRDYFWIPGALEDFDIHELSALIAPRKVLWLSPADHMASPVTESQASEYIPWTVAVSGALKGDVEFREMPDAGLDETCDAILSAVLPLTEG